MNTSMAGRDLERGGYIGDRDREGTLSATESQAFPLKATTTHRI